MYACVSIHVTNTCINVYVLWLHECLLVCMYCMYDYVFYACMYVLVVHYIHTYISERYIILFFILNFSLLATRFSLDWLHRSFSSPRWAAEKGSWTQQWKLQRQGRLSYVCLYEWCMYVYMCVIKCGCIYGILIYPSTYSFLRTNDFKYMYACYVCMHTKKIITTYTVQSKDAQSMQFREMCKLMR